MEFEVAAATLYARVLGVGPGRAGFRVQNQAWEGPRPRQASRWPEDSPNDGQVLGGSDGELLPTTCPHNLRKKWGPAQILVTLLAGPPMAYNPEKALAAVRLAGHREGCSPASGCSS